jgi:hypothetical protein
MFYAVPDNILYRSGPVYGDKDLFRLAWMRAGESFHMIQHTPGWAGQLTNRGGICGNTMVQHDPSGMVLFLHRNGLKLDETENSRKHMWEGLVEWEGGEGLKFWAHTWAAKRRLGFLVNQCYGPQKEAEGYKRISGPMLDAVFALEDALLKHAADAADRKVAYR